jgi:selenium metabolism protein YedF
MSNIIDCRGLKCPQPLINTKKHFDAAGEGEAIVVVDNEVAKNNILKYASSCGLSSEVSEDNGIFNIKLTKSAETAGCEVIAPDKKNTVILITTNKLGEGDDALGVLLMKSYLYALSESDKLPEYLIFLNAGVKLTTEGSESLEGLKKLVERGVKVLNCGTCLDFYNLKDKLVVGEISNMYTIIEKMNNGGNTIKL